MSCWIGVRATILVCRGHGRFLAPQLSVCTCVSNRPSSASWQNRNRRRRQAVAFPSLALGRIACLNPSRLLTSDRPEASHTRTSVEADRRIFIAQLAVITPPALVGARTELVHLRTHDIDSKPDDRARNRRSARLATRFWRPSRSPPVTDPTRDRLSGVADLSSGQILGSVGSHSVARPGPLAIMAAWTAARTTRSYCGPGLAGRARACAGLRLEAVAAAAARAAELLPGAERGLRGQDRPGLAAARPRRRRRADACGRGQAEPWPQSWRRSPATLLTSGSRL